MITSKHNVTPDDMKKSGTGITEDMTLSAVLLPCSPMNSNVSSTVIDPLICLWIGQIQVSKNALVTLIDAVSVKRCVCVKIFFIFDTVKAKHGLPYYTHLLYCGSSSQTLQQRISADFLPKTSLLAPILLQPHHLTGPSVCK